MDEIQKRKFKKGAKWAGLATIPLILLATYFIGRGSKHETSVPGNQNGKPIGAVIAGSKGLEGKVANGTAQTDNSTALASAYGPQAIASTENVIVCSYNGQTFILPKDYEQLPKGYIFGVLRCGDANMRSVGYVPSGEYTQKPSDVPDGDASNH